MRRDNIQQQIALQVGIALTAGMFSIVPVAYGAPVGGTSTTATISYSDVKDANNVVIGQNTKVAGSAQNNVVDWHDFSVAEKEKVVFDGNKNYMNIVTGANTSDINGKIQGGGEVYIINPNGVIFGKTAEVNVGSFYVSTREVAVSDAIAAAKTANSNGPGMSSVLQAGKSTSGAAMDVVNMGKIQATEVVLEGENIRILNSANITSNGTTPLTDKVTVRADEGYIHVGSKDGKGGGYTSEKLTAGDTTDPATVEKYKLVDSTNWKSTLGTGKAVSGNYMLSEDIDASKISGFKTVSSFTGKIDGNFYAVKKASGTSGLFASTNNATIVNMGVKDSTFSATDDEDTGAFIKTAVNTTLINVYNDNSNITNAGENSAGLVGSAKDITIKSSYSTGNVRDGNTAAGAGLVGLFDGGTNNEITDSYSTGISQNGLFSNVEGRPKIVFNRTFSTGTAFSNGNKNATIKNSVLTDTGQYRVTGNSGIEEDKTGTIDLTRLTGITSLVAKTDKQSWNTKTDITNTGGLQHSGTKLVRPAWRIYEGKTAPVLTAFTKGIKNVVYDFEYFAKNKTTGQYTDKDTAAYKYSTRSDSTVGNNKGQDLTGYVYPVTTGTGESATTTPATPGLIYNAETLKIISADGKAATSTNNNVINDKSAVFTTKGASTINGNVYYDAAGQKNAIANNGKKAFVWSNQNGYDLVGNNIAIAPRQVTITNNFDTQSIVKEYDGTEEAKDFVSGLFSGTSSSVSGILAADENDIKVSLNSGGTATFRNVNSDDSLTDAGTAGNEKVGANKRVQINGTVSLTNGSGGAYTGTNYVVVNAAGTSGNSVSINTAVPAAITQRQIKVSLNSGLGITKVYDGDAYVKDAQGNNRSFSSDDFTLDPDGEILTADQNDKSKLDLEVTPSNNTKYIDLTTKQDQVDAGTHGVAIAGITLKGTSADNYVLTDMSGNPIYSKQDLVTGYKKTTQVGQNGGGTLYTSGDITLRSLGNTGYKWYNSVSITAPHGPIYEEATKEYDGSSAYKEPVNSWVSNAPTTTSSTYTTTGMLPGDDLELRVTSADFTQNSTDTNASTNPTVKDAWVSGPTQGVRYNVTISGTKAKNYTIDGTNALQNGGTATVMGEGKITPRTIYITAPTAGTVTKKYNGNDVVENGGKTYFGLNDGYFTYADNNTYHHIVQDSNGNDDAQIVITGKYQDMQDSSGNTVLAKDVYYDAKNTTNPILDKNIVYTATIVQGMPQQTGSTLTVDPGTYASNNYRFNIAPNTNQVTFSGTGNITQAELGPLSFANVSKTFDNSYDLTNTNKTTAPQYTNDKIKLNAPTGIISGEKVEDVFYVDSNGYLDTDGAALLQSGALKARYGRLGSAGFTPNAHVYRDGNNNVQPVSVEYAGVSSLLRNHNYKLDAATQASDKVYGTGTINPFLVTDKSWIKLLRNNTPIEKTYDGYDTISNPLQYLQTTGNLQNQASINIQTPAGKTLPGLSATVADAHYKTAHSNNDTSQDVIYDVNIIETGDYGIADGQNNPQNINLKNAQGQVELTLTSGGVIKRKEIIANNPKNANYTKTYDATDVINDTGNNLIDISNDILSIDKNRVTNATTAKYVDSTPGAGDAADASYTNGDKTVEYTLKLNGDSFNDYYLHNGNDGNLVTGVGTIDKRNLQITGNKTHTKAYDGNINVTDMPTTLSGFNFGNSNDITVLTQDNFNMSALTGTYGTGNTDTAFTANSNVGSKDVQYSGFFTALGNRARNYTINGSTTGVGTAYGTGSITPAQFNGSFVLVLKQGINQIYSGSNIVGKLENNTSAADIRAFQESWIDFQNSGIKLTATSTGIDVPLASIGSNNYTIDSAVFTAGADVGKNKNVAYTISLNPTYVSSNYTGMPTTALLQGSINDGEIKAREVFVDLTTLAKNGLTKNYDATGAIYNNDNKAYSTDSAMGTVLTGSSIVTFDPVNTVNHTGLVKGTNASTGAYMTFNAGGSKVINYTADISGDSVSNYIFKDKNGNVLTNGQGAALTTNNNTINTFGVVLTPNAVNKTYDGTTAVTQSKAQGALQLGSAVGGQTVALQNINANTGVYDNPNVNPDSSGNPSIHKVMYSGLSLGDSNYKLVNASGKELNLDSSNLYTIDGTGTIDPANYSGQFVFKLKNGINQIYSGSADVGQLENNTTAADKDIERRKWVDLANSGADLDSDGVVDIALNNGDYTITQAVFTAGPDAGKNKQVDYTITLNPVALSNYTNIPASVVLNASITDGEIKAREVFVDLTTLAKNGLTKNYDATGAIYNNDNKAYSTDTATGNVLTGNSIIAFDTVNTTNHTGLVKGTNASTGAYTNFDAGTNKTIEYTVNISGDNLSNYIFKDKSGNTLYDNFNGPTQMAPLTTTNNTINAFGVVVTADQIAKPYDATDYVAPSTAQNALHLGSAVGNDVVSLQNPSGIDANYVGVNVDDDGDGTPDVHAVNYTGLDLGVTGSALTNYQLVDSNGNALGTDTNGLHKFVGTGIINPYKLTAGDVTINIGDASKTYDATKDVLKNGSVTDLTNNYITDHYVTIPNTAGGTQENLVFTSYNAEYNEANATANPVKPGNRVDYRLGLSNSNYDFSGLRAVGLVNNSNEWTASTGGTIDKAVVKAGLTNNPLDSAIEKTYDGDNRVIQDVTGKVSVTGLFTAKDGTVLNVNAINAQYKDKNVARDASGNVVDKDVYYHVELSGAAKDNYTIVGATGADYASLTDNTGTLTGTGRITPKELTIDFKPAERDYNGKANVNAADIQVEKFNGLQGTDSITLDSTAMGKITGTYGTGDSAADFKADGNVNRIGDAVGAKSVKYEHVADAYADYLARNLNTDAANYTVAKDTFYKESDNKGKINPVVLSDIKAKWQGVDKVYDAMANVLNPENTMKLVTKDTVLTGNEIELTYTGAASGVYVDSNGESQKDVGNHGLKYSVTEVKKNLGNYQLADSAADSAKRDWLSTTAADNADGQAVTGEITPLTLNVIAQNGFHKIYDGTEDIADSEVQAKIGFDAAQAAVVQRDIAAGEISYDVDAHYVGSDANVAPGVIRNQKDIAYSLTLKGNTKGNYILQGTVNDMVTDTAKLGDIEQRMVYVEPLNITGIDKTYDTTDAMPDGYSGNGRFRLKAADDSTGIVGNEDVSLDVEAIQGAYKSAHVQRDADGTPVSQEISFNNFNLKGSANLNNYLMATDNLTGSGTITPAPLTVSINKAPTKVYDGGTSFAAEYTANHNLLVQGWLQDADKVNAVLTDGGYTDANAGTNKEYSYNLNVGNDDYELTQGVGQPALRIANNGQSGQVTAQDGTITPRMLTARVIGTMNKEYDGNTDGVENAVANVSMSNVVNGDSIGLTATAVYDNPNAGKSEDTDELQEHQVTYTLSLANPNYQLETDTLTGTGTISRKGLTIVATPASVNMGEPLPQFTGTVEGLVPADSSLASSFTFATLPDVNTSNVTGAQTLYPIYGWYRNSYEGGNFGLNYTYSQDPANETAFTVNYINTDMGNPDLKPTPTHDVYQQVAKDVTSGFGGNNAASLQYVDKNGKVLATETIGSGTIATGETMDGLTVQGTDLANIGIVGGDIVNLEGAEAAGIANIEMQDKGAVVNLEVYSLNGEKTSTDGNPAAEIVSTDSRNALGSIQIVDESGHVLEEIDQDKAEKQEKEGEIAIQSSDGQNENEIELTVESTGVNVA